MLEFKWPRAPLLLLGVFHLDNPGLDAVKHPDLLDVFSPSGQAQIAEVVERLCDFRPTKVGVEVMPEQAEILREEYDSYVAGDFDLTRNEVHQLGFRVAKRLGLPGVGAIDAQGAIWSKGPWDALESYARAHDQERLLEIDERYGRTPEPITGSETLRERLLRMNEPGAIRAGHTVYLDGPFRVGVGTEYPGADLITDWWYSRNLRIFANIQRLTESPNDRVLVIIGAGHLPILRHCAECSPDHELGEVSAVLGA